MSARVNWTIRGWKDLREMSRERVKMMLRKTGMKEEAIKNVMKIYD